jgi:hypothetical protein
MRADCSWLHLPPARRLFMLLFSCRVVLLTGMTSSRL